MSEAEMEKGADTQTLSAKFFENCGLFTVIVEGNHMNCKNFFSNIKYLPYSQSMNGYFHNLYDVQLLTGLYCVNIFVSCDQGGVNTPQKHVSCLPSLLNLINTKLLAKRC